jgi:mannose-6-phosphate isomerase-like protein (cupin superfamily)
MHFWRRRLRRTSGSWLLFSGLGFLAGLGLRVGAGDAAEKKPVATRPAAPGPSAVVRWEDAVPHSGKWGEMRTYFRGDSFATRDVLTAVAVVAPGQAVHAAHRHAEEEYLVLTEGAGQWHLDGREFPARKGDILYVAPWVFHGLRNTGHEPLTFVVVRYNPKGVAPPPRPDMGADEK